jgi:NAD(P)-dependent dehydrogenase (short-subunit alcohol dehydrogenase family)
VIATDRGPSVPERWALDGVAVVTGAARGIGAAVAHRLAERGATVVLADIETRRLAQQCKQLTEKGFAVAKRQVDVASWESVEALASSAAELGALRYWINNAGIIDRTALLDIDAERFDSLMTVNARGCLFGIQSAARRMESGASIVNTASMSSSIALHNTAHYGASKAAVALLTKNAALELAPLGIRVNAVAPGSIRTAFTEERLAQPGALARTELRIPLGRVGVPDDVAGPIAFLCSPEAAYITGAILAVDGGWTAW